MNLYETASAHHESFVVLFLRAKFLNLILEQIDSEPSAHQKMQREWNAAFQNNIPQEKSWLLRKNLKRVNMVSLEKIISRFDTGNSLRGAFLPFQSFADLGKENEESAKSTRL